MKNIKKYEQFHKLNELGPRFAATAMNKYNNDERTLRIKRSAITSMFSEYINRNLPFVCKTKDGEPVKYRLIDIYVKSGKFDIKLIDSQQNRYLVLDFMSEEEVAPELKSISLQYDILKDEYDRADLDKNPFEEEEALPYALRYFNLSFNRYFINTLIKIANKYREMYFEMKNNQINAHYDEDGQKYDDDYVKQHGMWFGSDSQRIHKGNGKYSELTKGINKEANELKKKSRLRTSDFKMFNYDSGRTIGNTVRF
jgi:hypothetical protein